MRPAAIALNYSVKNIWNDVQHMIHTEKSAIQLTSVGLAHARPNYKTVVTMVYKIMMCKIMMLYLALITFQLTSSIC